ncbi:hypothetical protein F5Y12DRAFT_762901 [Xylaria sp. FL1777]|nr:hypothetical protein F5Y12DRAFT_762901 [Xylaria sp. FL1777]
MFPPLEGGLVHFMVTLLLVPRRFDAAHHSTHLHYRDGLPPVQLRCSMASMPSIITLGLRGHRAIPARQFVHS